MLLTDFPSVQWVPQWVPQIGGLWRCCDTSQIGSKGRDGSARPHSLQRLYLSQRHFFATHRLVAATVDLSAELRELFSRRISGTLS
jgi:hypothetical protein